MNQSEQIRNDNYHAMQRSGGLSEGCRIVLKALRRYGPCTTRALAWSSGIDILTIRPRITDLMHVGMVRTAGHDGREGIYAAYACASAPEPEPPPPASPRPETLTFPVLPGLESTQMLS